MAGMLRVPRSRGALTGALLVLLGIWGGLIAFVGPYFHYAYTPDKAWTYTTGRLWLEILPAAAAVLGGLIVGGSASRPAAIFGAWLAALSGAWFALGGLLSTLWTIGGNAGHPVGDNLHRVTEQIGFFTGLGVVIVFLAAVALGRFTVIGHRERLAAEAPVDAPPEEQLPADDTVPVREPIGARASTADGRLDDSHGLDDTRTDTPRVTDTAEPRTAPETLTPPNTAVEETHVAGSPTSRDSGPA
ncbi:MAG TPA: hypothetical protein VH089_01185 [Streptosporangiaceae bacterium]|nr:hypothetical protein [Streptosporangiaceae bacterium]